MPATLQIRLIPATSPRRAQAGFLPGSDVSVWLEDMSRHPGGRFYAVPETAHAMEAGGLLVVPAQTATPSMAPAAQRSGQSGHFSPRVMPCALEHGCVAVPVAMQMDPRMTAEETRRMLPYAMNFFHPTVGLVSFDEQDAITPAALVVPPLPRGSSWMRAAHGHAPLPRLTQVRLALPDGMEDLFGEASDGIGELGPKDLQDKAPLMERLKDKLRGGAAAAAGGLVSGLGKLAGMFGGKNAGAGDGTGQQGAGDGAGSGGAGGGAGAGASFMGRIQRWTAEQLEKLQRQRESEIQRLLKMLQQNPEEGLRFALPIGGSGGEGRGVAPPSGNLVGRDPVFGARRGGRGPADVWNISDQARWELQRKYRELANRELAEGRYDRAAYIFAHLLGDWLAAAGALAQGKKHQEAARIYLEKLNNKTLAAKCLEEGGLLADAVMLYAELGEHEKCGDLLRRLGKEREAVAAYQQAILGKGDRLHDARILFEKLDQRELAIAVLESGWPHSAQARPCLEKQFEYLRLMGAHDYALRRAGALADPALHLPEAPRMAETLHAIYQAYPDGTVQAKLSVVAFGVIGTALAREQEKPKPLLDLLPRFAPSDLVLRRDASRYLDQRSRAAVRRKPPETAGEFKLSHQRTIQLPTGGIEWSGLITLGTSWLTTGYHPRTRQDVWVLGEAELIMGKLTSAAGWASQLRLNPLLLKGRLAWLPMARPDEWPRYAEAGIADFASMPNTREMMLSRLSWMPHHILAACHDGLGAWVLTSSQTGTYDLSYYTPDGRLRRTHAISTRGQDLPAMMHMEAHESDVFIAGGAVLVCVKQGQVAQSVELQGIVSHLSVSPPTHPPYVVLVAGTEVLLFAPGKRGATIQLHASLRDVPCAAILRDGHIVVGDSECRMIYSPYPHLKLVGKMPGAGHSTSGRCSDENETAMAPWGLAGLAILRADGALAVWG